MSKFYSDGPDTYKREPIHYFLSKVHFMPKIYQIYFMNGD